MVNIANRIETIEDIVKKIMKEKGLKEHKDFETAKYIDSFFEESSYVTLSLLLRNKNTNIQPKRIFVQIKAEYMITNDKEEIENYIRRLIKNQLNDYRTFKLEPKLNLITEQIEQIKMFETI